MECHGTLNAAFKLTIQITTLCLAVHLLLFSSCTKLPHSVYKNWCSQSGSLPQPPHRDSLVNAKHIERLWPNAQIVRQKLEERRTLGNVSVCVGLLTVVRQGLTPERQYLLETFARLLPLVLRERDVSFVLVNAAPATNRHLAAERVARFVPVYYVAKESSSNLSATASSFEKERHDKGHLLRACLQQRPRYILALEDDAAPRPELFSMLWRILNDDFSSCIPTRRWKTKSPLESHLSLPSSRKLGYIKLYYPEWWSGFENRDIPDLIGMSVGIGWAIVFLLLVWTYWRKAKSLSHRTQRSCIVLVVLWGWLFSSLCVMSVLYTVNKHHLNELRRLIPSLYQLLPADACCTPAVLYRADAARVVSTFLLEKRHGTGPVFADLAIHAFLTARNWTMCMVKPYLVEHIGRISSLPK